MHIILGRYLGPADYGLFGVVLYAVTMARTPVGAGFPMAAARYISAQPECTEDIFQKSLMLQLLFAGSISVAFYFAAPVIASFLGDTKLTVLFRIGAPLILIFGGFIHVSQYYNGLRRYGAQSFWLIFYYILRGGLVIFFVLIGLRVLGAVTGLVVSSAVACFFVFITRRKEENTGVFPARKLLSFSVPLIVGAIAMALVIDLDLMFVKRLIPSSVSAGHYTSAKTLARVTLFIFFAFSSALYPAVSKAHARGDWNGLRRYIQQANQMMLMVLMPLIVVVILDSQKIINIIFGADYSDGASALRWLIVSFSILSIYTVQKTIITGCGFPKIASGLTLSLLPLSVILLCFLIPAYGLVGAAVASTLTHSIGACCSLLILYMKFKAGFHFISTLQIISATLLLLLLDFLLTRAGVALLPKVAIATVSYFLALGLTGELRLENLYEIIKFPIKKVEKR